MNNRESILYAWNLKRSDSNVSQNKPSQSVEAAVSPFLFVLFWFAAAVVTVCSSMIILSFSALRVGFTSAPHMVSCVVRV